MKSQLFFLIFLLFSLSKIKAENFPNDSNNVETQEKFNHFMTGIDWSSCSIFYGKKNQNEKDQYSLTYYLIYQTKSNINASLSTVSIFGGGKFIDEYELGLGYLFKFFDKKLVNSINITKYIYADSIQVQSNIKADLNYFIKFKNDILIPKVMFDYYYEDGGNDYLVTYQLYHDFNFENLFHKEDIFSISPKISILTGTQNFMDFYLKKYLAKTYVAVKNSKTGKVTYKVRTKVVKEKDPITGKVISTTVPVTKVKKEEVDYSINLKYGVNTYELILPLSYNLGEFTLNFQFAYYINVRQPKDFAVENYPVYDVGITYEF